jgi:hypothetical protein
MLGGVRVRASGIIFLLRVFLKCEFAALLLVLFV